LKTTFPSKFRYVGHVIHQNLQEEVETLEVSLADLDQEESKSLKWVKPVPRLKVISDTWFLKQNLSFKLMIHKMTRFRYVPMGPCPTSDTVMVDHVLFIDMK
jgi:hypothetical protein